MELQNKNMDQISHLRFAQIDQSGHERRYLKNYYEQYVLPLIEQHPDIIDPPIYAEDKQEMYDQLTDVYHTSKLEVCPFIQGECIITKTNFHGNQQTLEKYVVMSDDEILETWVEELKLEKDKP